MEGETQAQAAHGRVERWNSDLDSIENSCESVAELIVAARLDRTETVRSSGLSEYIATLHAFNRFEREYGTLWAHMDSEPSYAIATGVALVRSLCPFTDGELAYSFALAVERSRTLSEDDLTAELPQVGRQWATWLHWHEIPQPDW